MTKSQKLVLVVAILGSFVAFLDGAVVNVALPAMRNELGGNLASQQWIVNAYLLTLGSFILIAGSISDLFGRKKVFALGLIGFGLASLLCAIALDMTFLIIARALQGAAGALLVPSGLALITTKIQGESFAKAIGQWTAWTGIAFVIGPLVGGFLTDTFSWRWIFVLNVLPIAVTLFLMTRLEKEHVADTKTRVDFWGGLLCALGLAGIVYALTEQPNRDWSHYLIWGSLALGIIFFAAFFWREKTTRQPMLPLRLFLQRNFSVGNLATLLIYAGLSALTLLLVLFLQQIVGYSALKGGLALLPITLIMFIVSPLAGKFSKKYGPRWFMTFGPLIGAVGMAMLGLSMNANSNYLPQVLPGLIIFGLGLSITVSPLTTAILSDVDSKHSGIASAVNNAVARIAGLLAIAAIGTILTAQFGSALKQYIDSTKLDEPVKKFLQQRQTQPLVINLPPEISLRSDLQTETALKTASEKSFRFSMLTIATLVALGGIVSAVGIKNKG